MKYLLFLLIFIVLSSFLFSFFNRNSTDVSRYSEDIYDYSAKLINGKQLNVSIFMGPTFYLRFLRQFSILSYSIDALLTNGIPNNSKNRIPS